MSSTTAAQGSSVDAKCHLSESNGNTLRAALQEPSCLNIVLHSDYTVASGEFSALGAPLPISRGTGLAFDAFVGKPGSVLSSHNVKRLRMACISAASSAAVVQGLKRSNLVLGTGQQQQQQVQIVEARFRGKLYPGSLLLQDVAIDIPQSVQEGRGLSGGYSLASHGDIRLCENWVPESCLAQRSADACIVGLIDDLTAAPAVVAAAEPQKPGSGATKILVAVPVAVVGELLGSGSFGRVYRGRWNGQEVAVKIIEHGSDTIAAVENELQLMFSFTHQNIEYCTEGTLSAYIATFGSISPQKDQDMLRLLLLLRDAAQGLGVLHERNVVHGDLNRHNVLVTADPGSPVGVMAKVADLGLARVVEEHKTHRTTGNLGTMSHNAPELLRSGRMSLACDVYAFGIMMWELYTGQQAFKKLQYGQFFETVVLRNLRPMIPQGMPADYQLLMEHCWATDPQDRPTVDRLLEFLAYMVSEREESVAAASASKPGIFHPKAPHLPSLLFQPLPEKLRAKMQRKSLAARERAAGADKCSTFKGFLSEAFVGGGRLVGANDGFDGSHHSSQNSSRHSSKHGAAALAAGAGFAARGATAGSSAASTSCRQWRNMLLRRSVDIQQDNVLPAERTRRLSMGDRFSRKSLEPNFRRQSLEAMAEHHPQLFDDAEPHFAFDVQSLQPEASHDQYEGRRRQGRASLSSDTQQGGRSSLSLDVQELSMVGRESSWFQSIREHSMSRAGHQWFV
eukprot:gene3313-3589_t